MAELLIVYHSITGGSRQMAEAAADAAREEIATVLKTADAAGPVRSTASSDSAVCACENSPTPARSPV